MTSRTRPQSAGPGQTRQVDERGRTHELGDCCLAYQWGTPWDVLATMTEDEHRARIQVPERSQAAPRPVEGRLNGGFQSLSSC